MGRTRSIYPDICSRDLTATRDFYVTLLDLQPVWESDWYIALEAPGRSDVQLAVVDAAHESVPEQARGPAGGVLISFEVEDATDCYERAVAAGYPIVVELHDAEAGQRHFMTLDPNGFVVDIIQTLFIPDADRALLTQSFPTS